MAEKLSRAAGGVERLLLPRLNSIDGDLKALNTKVDSMHTELKTEIRALSEKVEILPRLAVLEAKMKELEKRS